MNSNEILEALDRIADEPGKKAKEDLLRPIGLSREGMRVLRAAYDPFVTYGIAKMPEDEVGRYYREELFDDGTWALLDRLARRDLTGNAAKSAVAAELGALQAPSAELFERILKKDLRAGFTEGTINRVFPGTITTFDCQLAEPYEAERAVFPGYLDPKVDGFRLLAFVDLWARTVRFCTRNGNESTAYEHLKEPLMDALENDCATEGQSFVVDGEVVSGSFADTASGARKKDEQDTSAVFVAFEILTLDEWNSPDNEDYCYTPTLEERHERLIDAFGESLVTDILRRARPVMAMPWVTVASDEEVQCFANEWRALGLEGAMYKRKDARYRKARSYDWMKLKAEETEDLPVVGACYGEEGKKHADTFGGLIVRRGTVLIAVRTGFDDKLRAELKELMLEDARTLGLQFGDIKVGKKKVGRAISALLLKPAKLLGRLAEVQFHEVTPDGSLRHPRFARFRDDK